MTKRPREVTVARRDNVTPNLVAVRLVGDSLDDFPEGIEGGYIKLTLPQDEGRTQLRSYTVRRFDSTRRELEIQMAVHEVGGPASAWLQSVSLGDPITIQGPGPCRRLNPEADWILVAGDMSALPAIAVNLELLPPSATGHAVLEVLGPEDQVPQLAHPPGVEVSWVHNPEPARANTLLEEAVRAVPWRPGRASVWVAGEYSTARALRQYFRDERHVQAHDLYASCYWKIGDSDEGMKAAKKADSESW